MFSNAELYKIADWCCERDILPSRVDYSTIKAATKSLNINFNHELSSCEIKEIETIMEM